MKKGNDEDALAEGSMLVKEAVDGSNDRTTMRVRMRCVFQLFITISSSLLL